LFQKFKKQLLVKLSLLIWIVALIVIGGIMGSLTKADISAWYNTLNRAPLTPPNEIFPVAWTILYGMMGVCGWLIWRESSLSKMNIFKVLYVAQLILNWSWTPLFFSCHFIGASLLVLVSMDILASMLILIAYPKIRIMSLLMLPYLFWILFATYLNFYMWWYN
jgi:benzodiazapine receptor